MVQRTQVLYVDDIDGSDAEGTVRFGLGGTDYEIDLSKKHADQFAKAIAPYIEAARKVPSSRRAGRGPRSPRHDQSDVRRTCSPGIALRTRRTPAGDAFYPPPGGRECREYEGPPIMRRLPPVNRIPW